MTNSRRATELHLPDQRPHGRRAHRAESRTGRRLRAAGRASVVLLGAGAVVATAFGASSVLDVGPDAVSAADRPSVLELAQATPTRTPSSRASSATPSLAERATTSTPASRRTVRTTSPAAATTTPSTTSTTRTTTTRTTKPATRTSTSSKPRTSTTSKKPAAPATTAATAAGAEAEVLRLVNVERSKAGCKAVTSDATLVKVARAHSRDMAENGYFAHESQDGRSPFDRMSAAGYSYSLAAENIAAGQRTASSVMSSWMNSAGHKANILNCKLTELGVGMWQDSSSPYGIYWTQDFGTPR